MRKSLLAGGFALAAAALLAGCGGTDSDMSGMSSGPATSAQQASHNQQDIMFAQMMSEHHRQAIAMAKLVPSRSTNAQVRELADRIEKAQDPEIQQMQGWLTQWGAAPTSTSSMPGMTGSMSMPATSAAMAMPGGMSDADMQKLEQATGTEFDSMFLQMMIQHHQGAIDMAKTELAQGADADAKALAQKVIDAQQAEITEMQGLLNQR